MQYDSQSDDMLVEEDDREIEEQQNQKIFHMLRQQKSDSSSSQKQKYQCQIFKPIEMIFIIFSHFKQEISQISTSYHCNLKFAMQKIRITSENNEDDLDKCQAQVNRYLNKINYIEIKYQNKFQFYNSPHFFEKSQQLQFGFTKFNNKIYCHSASLSESSLSKRVHQLFVGKKIFSVCFKSGKQKDQDIHSHIRNYIRGIIRYHNGNQFKDRNVIVELDRQENKVSCIGQKQKNLLACKNTMKNVLYSTVAIIIKYNETSEQFPARIKKIKKYSEKISNFPIYAGQLSKKSLTVISKENILRSLIKKEKFKELLALKSNNQIGLYFLGFRKNFDTKNSVVEEVCNKKGFDFTNFNGSTFKFFRKIFLEEHEKIDIEEVLEILAEALDRLRDIREKFDVPSLVSSIKPHTSIEIEVNQGEFYSTGETVDHEQLSDLLRRNVLKQKLRMSKPELIKYKITEGEQIEPIYWYLEGNRKIECEAKTMVSNRQYFQGKVKVQNEGEKVYFVMNKILIL